ncbi:hypothetical protein A2154_00005, partial [Candidatus Gottesmanbacteria bacterium RBG_16_43_7]
MKTPKSRSKAVFLGVDGVTWTLLDPFIQKDLLPNFKRLKSRGSTAVLESTYPPSSPPAWTSMFTGVTPGKHRIFDFIKRKPKSYFVEPIFSVDCTVPTLWDYATRAQKQIIALNIPFAYPLSPTHGIITAGLGAPSKDADYAYPQTIKAYIDKHYPDFDIDFEEQSFDLPRDRSRVITKVTKTTENQIRVARDFFVNRKWDLFALVLRSPDVMQHFFLDDTEVMQNVYTQLDQALGWFMDHLDEGTTLIVASDHGFKRVATKFYLNNWLAQAGYLRLKPNAPVTVNAESIEKALIKLGLRRLVWTLKKSPFLEALLKLIPTSSRIALATRADWSKTRLYYMGISNNGLIFINRTDREPEGIVAPTEVYLLYRDVKSKLSALTFSGKKIVDKVIFADDVYTYGSDRSGPDIIVSPSGAFTIEDGLSKADTIFEAETVKIGNHHPHGILGIFNKRQTRLLSQKQYSIYDVTPTILCLLGI